MRRIHDLRCIDCEEIETDVLVDGDDFPGCRCGGARTWVPSRVNTDILGGPTYYASLDQTFGSRSELKSYLRENGLQEAGDRVGGARNESHLNLGKGFSFGGQRSFATAAEKPRPSRKT